MSERGGDCVMRLPQSWSKSSLKITPVSDVEWLGGDRFFSFKTAKGASYTLTGLGLV